EIPGIEPPMPDETCGSEPPMLEHVVMLPGAAPNGDVPDVIGLTPGDESSVAPMGMPVRGTAGGGPGPKGGAIPAGGPQGKAGGGNGGSRSDAKWRRHPERRAQRRWSESANLRRGGTACHEDT